MRIVFSGGGTAGHINPALAMADTVRQKDNHAEILFYGGEHGLERSLVTHAGYPFHGFVLEGLHRSLSPKNVRALYRAMRAYLDAKKSIKAYSPDLVVGTGGYVCWPILQAAHSLGIPTVLHESNAVPGFATKCLLSKVDLLLINQDSMLPLCKGAKNIQCVGNPIRSNFFSHPKHVAKQQLFGDSRCKVILSFGGSLGAQAINNAVLDLLPILHASHREVFYVHVTGDRGYHNFLADPRYQAVSADKHILIHSYLHNLPLYLSAADMAICRAGAMTLSELALTQTPAILIPSPNVTGDHQSKNADSFANAGAAAVIAEETLTGRALANMLETCLFTKHTHHQMRSAMQKLAKPRANEQIFSLFCQLLAKKP